MADDEQEEPRRPRRPRRKAEPVERNDGGRVPAQVPAQVAARRATEHVVDFTGRAVESVVSIDRSDGVWEVGVEVVETTRIPDTQDVLAIYEVRVDGGGDLVSYRRTRRYARGQLDGRS